MGTTLSALWSFVFDKKETKPNADLPRQDVELDAFVNRDSNQLHVAWLGHSSLLINIDGLLLLTDPVLEKSISFFGPSRYNGPAPIKAEQLPEIDIVLISHDHYDHLNKFTIQRIHEKTSAFVTPLGVGRILESWGVSKIKITELDWWEEVEIGHDFVIVSTPSQHFSGRGLTDRNKTLWSSYVIESGNRSIFFGGDSGYFDGFKEIGRKYGPFDMTFLECGAYDKRWTAVHMLPEETVQAHLDLKGVLLHPIHWGTFDLALHPWYEPMNRLMAAAESADIDIATPPVGGTTTYGSHVPRERWWNAPCANIVSESDSADSVAAAEKRQVEQSQ
jgi:L-ascorbate metabolism protein UlaG (beta-lactamase superfamily)